MLRAPRFLLLTAAIAVVSGACGSGSGGDLFAPSPVGTGDAGPDATSGGPDAARADGAAGVDGSVPVDAPVTDAVPPPDVVTPPDASGCGACGDGSYCDPSQGRCVSCADTSRVVFGPPITKMGVSGGPGTSPAFPRIGVDNSGARMVYEYTAQGGDLDLAQSAAWVTQAGTPMNAINTSSNESGPLLLPSGASFGGVTAGNNGLLLFDSDRTSGGNTKRSIFMAANGVNGGNISLVPGTINAGTADYHVAAAWKASPPRAYWVSTRAVGPQSVSGLFTTTPGAGVATPVPLVLPDGCPCQDPDPEPWVTTDGALLFFDCADRDPASCGTTLDGGRAHLFYATMDAATGQQVGAAIELKGANKPGADDVTPSLGLNGCSLFFASNRAAGGSYAVYRATRQ